MEDVFQAKDSRERFWQKLLSANTIFARVMTGTGGPDAEVAAQAYWQGRGRSRAVESLLNATSRLQGHDRIDLAHLLPRLARALMHTYPPDSEVAEEPSVENAAVAATFFAPGLDPLTVLADGFSQWLAGNAVRVEGPREFGDIVVFEDAAQNRWPYSLVYVADGLLFGRPPTLHGPWQLLPADRISRLNPRLHGNRAVTYRVREGRTIRSTTPTDAASGMDTALQPKVDMKELPPGPWGRLKCYELMLSPSTELLERLPAPARRPAWTFAGIPVVEIRRVIDSLDLSKDVRTRLRQLFADARADSRGRVTVLPSEQLVRATPPGFREKLFPYLVHGTDATDYAQNLNITTRQASGDWLSPDVLPEALRRAVLDLVYRRGAGLALSDFGALYLSTPEPEQRLALLRVVFGTPVLVVLLERPSPEEVPGLADYWRLDQQKSIGRLLGSFAQSEAMSHLDVVHLLPPLAREMMNLFMHAPANAPTPSCYWSALNFAAEQPDSRLLVTPRVAGQVNEIAWQKLQDEYVPVGMPARLGDVIVYRRKADGDLRHLCAYVAADVVYTKNGYGSSNPWCLMHLSEVDALYLLPGETERLVFRPRETVSFPTR